MPDNSTGEQVQQLVSLIVTLLPILIVIAVFSIIIRLFLGSGGGLFSKLDSPEPTRQTFGLPEQESAEDVAQRVTCSYCGGDAYGTELHCPHCYAPANKAFPRVA